MADNDAQAHLSDSATFEVTVGEALLARTAGTQRVTEKTVVTLDGSESVGSGLSQEWTQILGPAVNVTNARSGDPSFIAPAVNEPTLLRFELVVTTQENERSEPAILDVIVDINDSDEDGLRDRWEISNFGDLRFAAIDDPDGDGVSNADEFAQGTDPFALVIQLCEGWNLISLAREPLDNSVESLFGNNISGAVWGWDAHDRIFMIVNKLKGGQGYWAMANRDCTGDNAIIIHLP